MIRYSGDDRPSYMQDPGSGWNPNEGQEAEKRRENARNSKDKLVKLYQELWDFAQSLPEMGDDDNFQFGYIYNEDALGSKRTLIHAVARLKTALAAVEATSGYKKALGQIRKTPPCFKPWSRYEREKTKKELRILMKEACALSGHPYVEPETEPEYDWD